jgi:hypothetical protein
LNAAEFVRRVLAPDGQVCCLPGDATAPDLRYWPIIDWTENDLLRDGPSHVHHTRRSLSFVSVRFCSYSGARVSLRFSRMDANPEILARLRHRRAQKIARYDPIRIGDDLARRGQVSESQSSIPAARAASSQRNRP